MGAFISTDCTNKDDVQMAIDYAYYFVYTELICQIISTIIP